MLISPVLADGFVEVWGVSDRLETASGTLRVSLLTLDGQLLWQSTESVSLPGTNSSLLWQVPVPEALQEVDPSSVVFSARLEDDAGGAMAQEGLLYFSAPGSLALEVPTIRIESDPATGGVRLTLESDVLAKGVYLQAEGARFSRNFFDLLPGRPVTVTVTTDTPPESFEGGLFVRTLAEVPQEGLSVEGDAGTR